MLRFWWWLCGHFRLWQDFGRLNEMDGCSHSRSCCKRGGMLSFVYISTQIICNDKMRHSVATYVVDESCHYGCGSVAACSYYFRPSSKTVYDKYKTFCLPKVVTVRRCLCESRRFCRFCRVWWSWNFEPRQVLTHVLTSWLIAVHIYCYIWTAKVHRYVMNCVESLPYLFQR